MKTLHYIFVLPMTYFVGFAIATAMAADMRVPVQRVAEAPPSTWAGFYLGVEGGYLFDSPIKFGGIEGVDFDKISPRGGVFGAYLGHNWQAGPLVFGVELNADWAGSSKTAALTDGEEVDLALKAKVDYFGAAAGRLGLVVADSVLVFVKGGVGFAHATGDIVAGGATIATAPTVHYGPMFGAGLDWRVFGSSSWLLRLSWEHYALGKSTYAFGGEVSGNVPASLDLDVFKAGLAYKF